MERWMNKLLALLVIMLVMLVVVFVPFKIMECFTRLGRRGQVILARLNCFTGGIFLGTCLLFLLPEVSLLLSPPIHSHFPHPHPIPTILTNPILYTTPPSNNDQQTPNFNPNLNKNPISPTISPTNNNPKLSTAITHSSYPYPQLVVMLGFLLIMFIERLVHACRQKGSKRHTRSLSIIPTNNGDFYQLSLKLKGVEEGDEGEEEEKERKERDVGSDIIGIKKANKSENYGRGDNDGGNWGGKHRGNNGVDDERPRPYMAVQEDLRKMEEEGNLKSSLASQNQARKEFKKQVSVEIEDQVQDKRLRERGEVELEGAGLDEETTTKAVILFIALVMDEILGGLSMGLQRSNAGVWGMVVGLLAHEAVVGFSFGLQLASLAKRKRCLAYTLAFFYAIMTPVGAALGLIISELTVIEHIDTINGVLQGMATGVFLYVTFFEILEGEIHSQTPITNIACFTLGCAIMAAIAALPKTHNHPTENVEALNSTLREIVGNLMT